MAQPAQPAHVLPLLELVTTFELPDSFYCDVAVTAGGGLLACHPTGLTTYDLNGEKTGINWTPPNFKRARDEAFLVDETSERKVVVGLAKSLSLKFLKYSDPGNGASRILIEERNVPNLPEHQLPWSVHQDLLAVCELNITTPRQHHIRVQHTGNFINHHEFAPHNYKCYLYRNSEKICEIPLRDQPGSVAAMADGVILASKGSVPQPSDGTYKYVVKRFDTEGSQVWETPFDEKVCDICTGKSPNVLYLALTNAGTNESYIKAIDAVDGSVLSDASCRLELEPLKLSVCRSDRNVIAVLGNKSEYFNKHISVYKL